MQVISAGHLKAPLRDIIGKVDKKHLRFIAWVVQTPLGWDFSGIQECSTGDINGGIGFVVGVMTEIIGENLNKGNKKRIFVAGGSGLLGSRIVKYAKGKNEVISIYQSSHKWGRVRDRAFGYKRSSSSHRIRTHFYMQILRES